MKEEKIFLTKAFLPDFEEYVEEIRDLWESHWITTMGPKHNRLEEELQKYLNVDNVSVFVNGHNALELLISAMGLRGEVITTPFTFVSTTHAIVRNGLTPVFCDINRDDFTIDADKIEDLITERTTAILAVHVYGNPCKVEQIERIAKKYKLKVIYDAAHAFGVKYKGRNIAEYGDASIFSFHASKVFHTIEGGCAVYKDSELKSHLYKIRNFGIDGQDAPYVGTNAKMNEFAAAMGLCNLRHMDEIVQSRRKLTEGYIRRFSKIPGVRPAIRLDEENLERNYSYMPVLIDEELFGLSRDRLYEILNEAGVQALRHFYPLTSQFSCYKDRFCGKETPNARWVSEHILLLPLYADLSLEEVDHICDIISAAKVTAKEGIKA